MIKAPSVTSLRVVKLAAHFIHLKWDNVGGNFYYEVERAYVPLDNPSASNSELLWESKGYTGDTDWFDSESVPGATYRYRIRSTYATFEPADWVYTENLQTFSQNAYNYTKMNSLHFSTKFLTQKFANNARYINFERDQILAGLMGEDFVFYPEISHISSVEGSMVVDNERHEVQGSVSGICKDRERAMLCEVDGVLYMFERYQPVVKVSNDKGQNWVYYQAFNGRVGNPVARQCTYQSDTTTYVLGYNEIFYGRPSTNLRWSEGTIKFSTTEYTFAKLGEENNIDFPVEIFGNYIDLPADLNKRAEAMASSDGYLFVAGRNYIMRADISNPTIGLDGKRQWEVGKDYITTDPENRTVTKKLDVINGNLYALVTGRVKLDKDGNRTDPTKSNNVEASEYDGVYLYDTENRTWKRIYGNSGKERTHIDYTLTDMSTNGKEIFFTYANYVIGINNDEELPLRHDEVTSAVKFDKEPFYSTDKKAHLITLRTEGEEFTPNPQAYHHESQFVWSRRSGTRSWISPNYRAVVVYPERKYQVIVDPDKEQTKETWDKGKVTINLPNIQIEGFSRYANGIILYKSTGEIIGYYEFSYRVRDNANIHWKPDTTMMTAELIHQYREVPEDRTDYEGLVDPNLSPLLNTITPEHYMFDDGLFKSFSDNYIQYLSTGESSYYNRMKNVIRNKYPKEKNNFEYLFSEINRRNIYLDKEKRDDVIRFFETRASDFYSTKGVVDSYKFLFKLLYNADVDVEIESMNGLEYDVVVSSGEVTEDIVGTTVYTPTGRANVTYIEREYDPTGKLQWRITIHNLIGKFIAGQVLKSEVDSRVSADILVGVRGKELSYNNIDYINRGRVHYTMKIKSELPLTRYKDDILRFVHPVGFGFIGVTLITVLINSGLTFNHIETTINIMKAYKWDAGVPEKYPLETYLLDVNGNVEFDPIYDTAVKTGHTLAGKDPISDEGLWPDYDTEEAIVDGVKPSERRRELSPIFDAAWTTFAFFATLEGKRLKDRIGLPRDPQIATQVKVEQ